MNPLPISGHLKVAGWYAVQSGWHGSQSGAAKRYRTAAGPILPLHGTTEPGGIGLRATLICESVSNSDHPALRFAVYIAQPDERTVGAVRL
jgi:hypothetical protein